MRLLPMLFLAALCLLPAQRRPDHSRDDAPEHGDLKLPNGKSQREEILKVEHQKTLEDAEKLVKLSQELQDDLEKEDRHVLSLTSLKKAEEIEKLARRIRTRLKR